ncbi:MAG: alpha/beta hydrolase [Chromatiales bacterium]|nr:alpha/beta hydrolase [Chromatiales bacterium]
MTEIEFKVNGLKIQALEWNGGGLPVLALHGWLDNAASFLPLAKYLTNHHLVVLDLPGHGLSDHLPGSAYYHLADNIYLIKSVADAMGWQRFVLLGHSMGSAIAILVAAAMPDRIMAVTLLDGIGPIAYTPVQEVTALRQLLSHAVEEKVGRPFDTLQAAARIRQKYSHFAISQQAAELLVERNLKECDGGLCWRYDERLKLRSSHYYSEEQVRGILSHVECPSLLLSADQGALAGWSGFAQRRAAIPRLIHEVMTGGHHFHIDAPQDVANCLIDFYQTLDWER